MEPIFLNSELNLVYLQFIGVWDSQSGIHVGTICSYGFTLCESPPIHTLMNWRIPGSILIINNHQWICTYYTLLYFNYCVIMLNIQNINHFITILYYFIKMEFHSVVLLYISQISRYDLECTKVQLPMHELTPV